MNRQYVHCRKQLNLFQVFQPYRCFQVKTLAVHGLVPGLCKLYRYSILKQCCGSVSTCIQNIFPDQDPELLFRIMIQLNMKV